MSATEPDEGSGKNNTYIIGGVEIIFPYKAYPSQLAMMDKIIKSISKKQNCLLESPTGSGKSLALLCSALAWQKKFKKQMTQLSESLEAEAIRTAVVSTTKTDVQRRVKLIDPVTKKIIPVSEKVIGARASISKGATNSGTSPSKKTNDAGTPPTKKPNGVGTSSSKEATSVFASKESNCIIGTPPSKEATSICTPSKGSTCINTPPSKEVNNVNTPPSEKMVNLEDFAYSKKKKKYHFSSDSFNDDDDFQPSKHYKVTVQPVCSPKNGSPRCSSKLKNLSKTCALPATEQPPEVKIEKQSEVPDSSFGQQKEAKEMCIPVDIKDIDKCDRERIMLEKTPTIYFGTRTHKQISQIIRELKKTPYRDTHMTILSSRNKTCIHPKVSKEEGKNEACEELRSAVGGPACYYYRNIRSIHRNHPSCLSKAWDIEELVTKLKRLNACPYFSARELLPDSDIVFCPYNYLVDSVIRSSMCINLTDSVVIMDEAHNLEDAAREAASNVINQPNLEAAATELLRISPTRGKASASYYEIGTILHLLNLWLIDSGKSLSSTNLFDSASRVYAGNEMVAVLANVCAGPNRFHDIKQFYAKIEAEESKIEEDKDEMKNKEKLSGSTMILLKGLLTTLNYLYKENLKYMPDYRCVIQKKLQGNFNPSRKNRQQNLELTINFWCLNPAVAFSDFKETVHNVIVTSGTLSPMTSFQSELGLPFEIILETNHVVSSSQMWVGTISQGPKQFRLNATYANAETFAFQDEVGNLVLEICSVIPHGILCFLPSYAMLDKLTQRWQTTGIWNSIEAKKIIFCEPRGQSQNFEMVMQDFYNAVRASENYCDSEIGGALFIAVCRGKVSEGLDFSDNNARAVITIGIPFPSIKDIQVDLKKKYNNSLCSSSGLLSGNEWYEIQAFRALNQALGRCIRHKNDFGALIIVDERFQKHMRYISLLSKWIRKEIVHFQNCSDAVESLKHFSVKSGLTKNIEEKAINLLT